MEAKKVEALLAHASVFIIAKKPILANRLSVLFSEMLQIIPYLKSFAMIIWVSKIYTEQSLILGHDISTRGVVADGVLYGIVAV